MKEKIKKTIEKMLDWLSRYPVDPYYANLQQYPEEYLYYANYSNLLYPEMLTEGLTDFSIIHRYIQNA